MIRAVLFDLDDTLLDLNLSAFIVRYVAGASSLLARACRTSAAAFALPYARSFLALEAPGRDDDLTNRQVFCDVFRRESGVPLDDPVIADMIGCYERTVVPGLSGGLVRARPQRGARACLDAVRDEGLACALATNPTFSLAADEARLAWAGLSSDDFDDVSTLDDCTRCKPCARYYREFAARLGLDLRECLMVGNDATRDFARPECGLRTAYVGHGRPPAGAVWHGSVERLATELHDLVARLDEQGGTGVGYTQNSISL